MSDNVTLLFEINCLIREQQSFTKNIEIMKRVGTNDAGDSMEQERLTYVKQELKIQDNAIDMYVSRQQELLTENELILQRQLTHSGMRLPPLHPENQDDEEVFQEMDQNEQVIQNEEYVAQQQEEMFAQRTEVHQEVT